MPSNESVCNLRGICWSALYSLLSRTLCGNRPDALEKFKYVTGSLLSSQPNFKLPSVNTVRCGLSCSIPCYALHQLLCNPACSRWPLETPSLPFPRQRLGLWPNSCHGREGLPGRRRDGEIQIQGACFSVQRLQPHGSLHFALDRARAGPAVAGEGGELGSHCPL